MKKTLFLQLGVALLFSAAVTSCQPDDQDFPNPFPTPTATATLPGAPVPTAAQVKLIKWSDLDFNAFEYNDQGQLVKRTNQYVYVQNTDIVKRHEYAYKYNAAGQLTELQYNGGYKIVYQYNDQGVWQEAVQYNGHGTPVKKYEFTFNGKKQLVKFSTYRVNANQALVQESRTRLWYDHAGNMNLWREEAYQPQEDTFVVTTTISFSDFDDKKYAPHSLLMGEVTQPLVFWVNNPGSKEFLGTGSPVEQYSYTYNESGYPTSKATSTAYHTPLPVISATYTY
ncbi:MAG: hypothetical protein ACO1OQ_11175 [Rufibacter sp.]